MEISIRESCIRCGRCVKVCSSQIFEQEGAGAPVTLCNPGSCIVCGHCVAACPTGSVAHEAFPPERVHAADYAALPTPEQVELLMAVRRSNRALKKTPVPQEMLDRIVAAADRAPTASNARQLGYTLVTDPEKLRGITEYTLGVFGKLEKRLRSSLVRPWLSRIVPEVYRYVPVFERLRREYAEGRDRVLRGATAVGFVLTALRQDRAARLNGMLGLEGRRICAAMAFGMPQFRYPNYIDREPAEVTHL